MISEQNFLGLMIRQKNESFEWVDTKYLVLVLVLVLVLQHSALAHVLACHRGSVVAIFLYCRKKREGEG